MSDKVNVGKVLQKKSRKILICGPMLASTKMEAIVNMNWSEIGLKAEFKKVTDSGWLPYFQAAATATLLPTELLLAVASRETNMQNIRGDQRNGIYHGFGIMQIDIGTDYEFCCSWNELDVRRSIERGAQILAVKKGYLNKRGVTDLKAIAAAYNTGEGNVMKSINAKKDVDSTTTGGNYGKDIVSRMNIFKILLQAYANTTKTAKPNKA